MTNEELEQEVKRLEEQITNLRIKLLESKTDKKPYGVELPKDLEDYYYVDETGRIDILCVYVEDAQKEVYKRGLAFETREEVEQYDKERILLFKLHKWAEEHNEGWYPNWEGSDDKFYIYYFYNTESFCVGSDWNCNTFNKLPFFKSEELAREFIEEFGDEIKEVLL